MPKKFKPLSPSHSKDIYLKRFTISQVLSDSLVLCPSSGVYLPIDDDTKLPFYSVFQTKIKIFQILKTSPNRVVFRIWITVWGYFSEFAHLFVVSFNFFYLILVLWRSTPCSLSCWCSTITPSLVHTCTRKTDLKRHMLHICVTENKYDISFTHTGVYPNP